MKWVMTVAVTAIAAAVAPDAASGSALWLWSHHQPKFPESSVALHGHALHALYAEFRFQTAALGRPPPPVPLLWWLLQQQPEIQALMLLLTILQSSLTY